MQPHPCDHRGKPADECHLCNPAGKILCVYGGYCTCEAKGDGDERCPGYESHKDEAELFCGGE